MRWNPIFCDKDLQKQRNSKRLYSTLLGTDYQFLPKDLPTEPAVMPLEEGRLYKTSFYVWSDFGGYMKITSTIRFPEKSVFAKLNDIQIVTNIDKIVAYRAPIMF